MYNEVSIIISTYKRPDDLKIALESILIQSVPPKEVIIVDDLNDLDVKEIVLKFKERECGMSFKYVHNIYGKSLTTARNIGAKYSTGDIILFLDDDVILEPDFLRELTKVYSIIPNAKCVQGKITNDYRFSPFWNKFYKIFLMWHQSDTYTVLASGKNTRTYQVNKLINCQWATGANLSIKREIFEEFQFDEKLIKYCFGEDMDFSYRIYKKYPNGVLQTPYAKLIHNWSSESRLPNLKLLIMEKTYTLYFISKNMGSYKNYICFAWSELGILLKKIIFLMRDPSRLKIKELSFSLYSLFICIQHFDSIKNLDIEKINKKYIE